jgi:acyl-CoA thioesterase-1
MEPAMFLLCLLRTYGLFAKLGKVLVFVFMLSQPVFAAQPSKVLMLGDSLTQGYGLLDHEGLVPQLQKWFNDRGHDILFSNAGVSGDTTAGGLDRVEWMLDGQMKSVVVALGGNDMLRGIPPEASRENLRGILEILRKENRQIIVVGMVAPPNYGPEYKAQFDAIFPELAKEFDAAYIPSFFVPLMEFGLGSEELRAVMQYDGIHPNPKGVSMIVEYIGPILEQVLLP